jgi:hypothetical protein
VLIVDRGFLYFAKFVVGIVVIVIAFATAYFGFDLNKARQDVEQTRKDIQAAKESVLAISKEAQDHLAQAQRKSAETQAKLDELLSTAQRETLQIHAIVVASATVPATGSNVHPPDALRRGAFTIPEIAAAYHFPTGLDGTGQTLALIELGGGYKDTDLDAFFAQLRIRRPKSLTRYLCP